MTLLEALAKTVESAGKGSIPGAKIAYFAFSDDGDESAFLSEIEVDELIPLLERWCKNRRQKGGLVH